MSSILFLFGLVFLCTCGLSQAAVSHSRREWMEAKFWKSVIRKGDGDLSNQGGLNEHNSWSGDGQQNENDVDNTQGGSFVQPVRIMQSVPVVHNRLVDEGESNMQSGSIDQDPDNGQAGSMVEGGQIGQGESIVQSAPAEPTGWTHQRQSSVRIGSIGDNAKIVIDTSKRDSQHI